MKTIDEYSDVSISKWTNLLNFFLSSLIIDFSELWEIVSKSKINSALSFIQRSTKIWTPDKKRLPEKWYTLSADYYKNLNEIILSSTYNNLKYNTNY